MFVVLPLSLSVVASAGIARLVRNTIRRFAIGLYITLAGLALTPAPIVWGDEHLGLTSSQALEGYGVLFWIVGAVVSVASMAGVAN